MWKASAQVGVGGSPAVAPGAIAGPTAGSGTGGSWHPTVLFMLGLVVAEIVGIAVISKHLLEI